jgi:hypothetical protein
MSSGHDVSEYELDASGLGASGLPLECVCFTTTTVQKLIKNHAKID